MPRPSNRYRWLAVLVALAAILAMVVWVFNGPQDPSAATDTSTPAERAGDSPALVERGRYLAAAANCATCHTRPGGAPFSGGVAFETPFGTIYSSNITQDAEQGIGKWTLQDLARALHEGISAKGYRLFPAFPYTSFTKITNQDVSALYAYLRTVAPDTYSPPANGALFSARWAMAFWNRLFFRPGRFTPNHTQSDQWNTGAYLVEALGHCGACHTPRNSFMAEVESRAYQGGSIPERVDGGKIRTWAAVNLTSVPSGLKSWSEADLAKYLHAGFSLRAGTFGPMNEVIVNSTSQLPDSAVQAMAIYIKSLPQGEGQGSPVPAAAVAAGAGIYKERCEKCHGSSGRGGMFVGPPLAGSAIVQAENPASLINAVLYGATPPKGISLGAWETMQPYADVLSDAQIAAVANYVRGSWGNRAPQVEAASVTRQR